MDRGGAIRAAHSVVKSSPTTLPLVAILLSALSAAACGGSEPGNTAERSGIVSDTTQVDGAQRAAEIAVADGYRGPTVGAAKGFAALAQTGISARSASPVTGNLGVSGAPVSSITGFDTVPALRFGTDSSAPNGSRTILTQREVDSTVDDIDVRACDADYQALTRDATGALTLHPGVTCLNDSAADLLVTGHLTLDAGGDPNAFFVIRSSHTLTVADGTVVELSNGAQACSVFWRVTQQATIGRGVEFYGNVIAGTGIDMRSGSTLVGRALAQTAGVELDGNSITIPIYDASGSASGCTHSQ